MPTIFIVLVGALMIGCSSPRVQEQAQYDLGSSHALSDGVVALPPVIVADVNAPAWLDSTKMIYRLAYASDQQMRSYAQSRWTMPPARLFEHRLKARIAQAGGAVLSITDGAANLPLIRIDMEDFSQVFDSAAHSIAHVMVRVSVLRGRSLLVQRTFKRGSPTQTADAIGGAVALAATSDALIDDIIVWLAKQPLK